MRRGCDDRRIAPVAQSLAGSDDFERTGAASIAAFDDQVIVEIKAVERLLPLHDAQLLTYLRLKPCRVGLLINFNTVSLNHGIRRRVL